jgi:hypothetical protein
MRILGSLQRDQGCAARETIAPILTLHVWSWCNHMGVVRWTDMVRSRADKVFDHLKYYDEAK